MERQHRAVATFFADGAFRVGTRISLASAAAHHARVRRLTCGEAVRVTNGVGSIATGSIERLGRDGLDLLIETVDQIPPQTSIHLRVASADRDRMLWLAEKATELGVASWQVVRFERSASVTPRGEGPAFAERVRARMVAALEQSGGGWLPAMFADTALDRLDPVTAAPLLLDSAGEPLAAALPAGRTPAAVLVGPEGGVDPMERSLLLAGGWRPVCLAATTLRFETAAIAAIAAIRVWTL